MAGTRFTLEVQPQIPKKLKRLSELASNLLYSWDRAVRRLFFRLDPILWEKCGHNPKVFLRRVSQGILENAAKNHLFMEDYNRVLSTYDTYHEITITSHFERHLNPNQDLVGYFCAEFGLHESLPTYSGGLGILAGDHCKAASDLCIPFVAVGMLYRKGYFTQTIDGHGNQVAHYTPVNFDDLPITPVRTASGTDLHVHIALPGRTVALKIWEVKAGHITLYLLDSDLPENNNDDRAITYQLYGGGTETRIKQEIVLGIGGARALRALDRSPTVWHINEGHAAFQILERCREIVEEKNMDFESAWELVAANTVFTTHTPVPAGHDIFSHDLIATYFTDLDKQLGIAFNKFLALGESPSNQSGFNMTALALRGSRFHNGVSRIHGEVAARMESYIWPQIPHDENPISYVTNGVHVPTFLSREWVNLFDMRFGGEWRNELRNVDYWQRVDDIPDHSYWSLRQSLKSFLLAEVRRRSMVQLKRNCASEAQIEALTKHLNPDETDTLILGFARRFATYKRATLLFSDPERLARILNNPERPVILIFAGKAHPNDQPGQHLIQVIHDFSRRPEFEGRIVLVEGYDLALGRHLVTGVDVWINTPEYPMEASGTSGQKAGINGVINLSVLDGWWGEGYDGENGWAITPHGPQYDAAYRNREESDALLDILEHQVVPLYYDRQGHGYPAEWVKRSKASMKSTIPRFNAQRMVMNYVEGFYGPAAKQHKHFSADNAAPAKELAEWKRKVSQCWSDVKIRRIDESSTELFAGDSLPIRVAATLNGLSSDDVKVECLVGTENEHQEFVTHSTQTLTAAAAAAVEGNETIFEVDLKPALPGLQYYRIRIFPFHTSLSQPFETGFMIWL